jgi:hypothetical protein
MVDNIKMIKPLLTLTSTKMIKPVGHRQNSERQDLLKEAFKRRQKKKKKKTVLVKMSALDATVVNPQHSRNDVANKSAKESSLKKIIDIRV